MRSLHYFLKVIEATENHDLCKEKVQFGVKTDEHNFSLNPFSSQGQSDGDLSGW